MTKKGMFALGGFLLASHFLVLLYGHLAARLEWFPGPWFDRAMLQAAVLVSDPTRHHLHAARHEHAGVRRPHPRLEPAPGLTLVTGKWPDAGGVSGARLIDAEGEVVHAWTIDPTAILAGRDAGSDDARLPPELTYVHGSWLCENGDLVANLEFQALVRLDAHGGVRWRVDRPCHHSVHRAENGNFWVCASRHLATAADADGRFGWGIAYPAIEDLALEVDPDGRVVREISVLEALHRSPYAAALFRDGDASGDILHLNDVEPLPRALADQYPNFDAGDLLVSARTVDLVAVLDGDDGSVLWARSALWTGQHDPDWIGDGWISVYDNGHRLSRLVAVRPHDGAFRQIYPSGESRVPFFSVHGGKAQRLQDGTRWLLTEPQAGRVFEIDDDGREIWSWVQQREPDGVHVAEVLEGTRYPLDPAEVRAWSSR